MILQIQKKDNLTSFNKIEAEYNLYLNIFTKIGKKIKIKNIIYK